MAALDVVSDRLTTHTDRTAQTTKRDLLHEAHLLMLPGPRSWTKQELLHGLQELADGDRTLWYR